MKRGAGWYTERSQLWQLALSLFAASSTSGYEMNLLLICILAAVTLFSAAGLMMIALVGGQSAAQLRLAKVAALPGSERQRYSVRSMVSSISGGLASLRRPLHFTGDEDLAYRLSLAGFRQPEDVGTFLNAKILCPVLGVLAATFTGGVNVLLFSFV